MGIYPNLRPCIGVIVFESQTLPTTGPNTPILDVDQLKRVLKREHERDKLVRLLEVLQRLEE